ncbi:MAG TPA: hypothetical protein PK503_01165 [Azonexus sp.]|nr:hypothetical protein [Azonexus sp.]
MNAIRQEHDSEPAPAKSNDIAELRREITTLREELTSARPAATDR